MCHKLLNVLSFFLTMSIATGQTLDVELLELNFSTHGQPERFTEIEGGFYFTANDTQLWFTDGTKEGTRLFAKSTPSSDISMIFPSGGSVFFIVDAERGLSNHDLWVSDGTEEGTVQLIGRDLFPSQNGAIRNAIVVGDRLFFSTYNETFGVELWVSDGTVEGTFMLKDINEGENDSSPSDFFVFKERLFFKAYTEELNTELWVSDGTAEGTILFKDIFEGDQSSVAFSSGYQIYDDNFYFFANDGSVGRELWKSDGTPEGTTLVKDIYEGPSYNVAEIQGGVLNGKLLFLANDGIHGQELWETDGTPEGTVLFKDFIEGPESSFGYHFSEVAFSNKKAFFYIDHPFEGITEFWVSDGSANGTQFLKAISAGTLTFDQTGDSVYFFGSSTRSNYDKPLWKSDGTSEGTQMVSDIARSTRTSSHENDITFLNDKAFFAGINERYGIELWISDGTFEGTSLFYDFNSNVGANPSILTAVGDQLFFRGTIYDYYGLCTSDGTIEGTQYLDINLDGSSIHEDSEFIEFNGKLIVSANDGIHGYELWISDGTQGGTKMIKDINPGSASGMVNNRDLKTFTVLNERLYFIADDGTSGAELWTSDGTEVGTQRITDIVPGSGNTYPKNLVTYNGAIYFSANGALYKIDDVGEAYAVIALDYIKFINVVGDKLIFGTHAPSEPHDLWVSDGTAEGTQHLMSFGEGNYSNIQPMTILNDEMFFVEEYPYDDNNPDIFGKAVYKTDGTVEGTVLLFVESQHPFNDVDIDVILTCGGYVYFGVKEGRISSMKEIWRTDGTMEGTIPILSPEDFGVYSMNCFKDNLILRQYHGTESPIGLATGEPDQLYDFKINVLNSPHSPTSIDHLTQAGNKLYFSGRTGAYNKEIYVAKPLTISPGVQFTDEDGDEVIDLFDQCPETPIGESVNEEGCAQSQLDDDNDGVTNDLDECPETAPNEVVDGKGCSTSDLLDSDNDGITDPLDHCPNTPAGESVDEKGCSPSQLDDDNDGIMNNVDLCPETLHTQEVDANGCPVLFDLPSDNFSLEVMGVTCVDKNNGQIIISAVANHNYIAHASSGSYNFTSELTIPDLRPREYELCITIPEEPDFIRCFKFEIPDASEITGKSKTTISDQKVIESIEISSGTAPFVVSVNGSEQMITMSSKFSIEVDYGDEVAVASKFPCEGIYKKKIEGDIEMSFAPNPANNYIDIYLPKYGASEAVVSIYNTNLQLVKSVTEGLEGDKLRVLLEDLPTGIYYLQLETTEPMVFKIMKR